MSFKDHFSKQAEIYAQFRPGYPPELFEFLAKQSPGRELAWDCATGNGQAAEGLVPHFGKIFASDASAAQIQHAKAHPQIIYSVGTAEDSGLEDQSVDLISIATGLHWFDHDRFYREAKRVLKARGVIAAWVYQSWKSEFGLDHLVTRYEREILGKYWPPETSRWIWTAYKTLPFPFAEIPSPEFSVQIEAEKEGLLGFLRSWSGTQRYIKEHGQDPTELIREEMTMIFAKSGRDRIPFELKLAQRIGRN